MTRLMTTGVKGALAVEGKTPFPPAGAETKTNVTATKKKPSSGPFHVEFDRSPEWDATSFAKQTHAAPSGILNGRSSARSGFISKP